MPLEALTQNDKETLQLFFSMYGSVKNSPIDKVLRSWDKNKRTLYRALGKQLQVSKHIAVPRNVRSIKAKLAHVYEDWCVSYNNCQGDITKILDKDYLSKRTNNDFITDFFYFALTKINNSSCEMHDKFIEAIILTHMFSYDNVIDGYIDSFEYCVDLKTESYKFKTFNCTVKPGMKTMRTLQKILKGLHYPRTELFEVWKNQLNTINMNMSVDSELVLSINPIDFISMSDNQCNWRSCMSWADRGCYHAGTIEMMNSNVALVAYVKSPHEYMLDDTHEVPNKSWRALCFVNKHIAVVGKNYPFCNDEISKEVLFFIQELVQKNLGWTYQFKNQAYRDLVSFHGTNFSLRDKFIVDNDKKRKHRSILFCTNGMYNDIVEDVDENYWCCRNKPKHSLKINLSGPLTCVACGNRIANIYDIQEYSDAGQRVFCYECRHNNFCQSCESVNAEAKYKNTPWGTFCSDECANEYWYIPAQIPTIVKKERLLTNKKALRIFCHSADIPKIKEYIVNENLSDSNFLTLQSKLKNEFPNIFIYNKVYDEAMSKCNQYKYRLNTPVSTDYYQRGDISIAFTEIASNEIAFDFFQNVSKRQSLLTILQSQEKVK